jgi:hypothetical protein
MVFVRKLVDIKDPMDLIEDLDPEEARRFSTGDGIFASWRTVVSYLQERATSLQPFLFIAAISATRRIPAIRRPE